MISADRQRGSIFLVLFSAIAILGLVGVAMTSFIKGPMSSAVKMTRSNTAQAQMMIAAQSAVMAAANLGTNGDCDNDGYVEPVEWRIDGTKPNPTGGNLIPSNIGAPQTDPWGTDYGYCVWDHGSVTLNVSCRAAGSDKRLAGTNAKNLPVVAIVSAGPDKNFDTTCRSFTAADVNSNGVLGDAGDYALVQKNTDGNDDLIFGYTYEEASAASGGLWTLKSADATTATINKSIEAPSAKFTGTSMLTSVGGTPSAAADCTGLGNSRASDPATGHCYWTNGPVMTWATASSTCQSEGGYLATVTSASENAIVSSVMTSYLVWLSGSDATSEGVWKWTSGEENGVQFWQGPGAATGGVAVGGQYNGWTGTEPNGSTSENCAVMNFGGPWRDIDCTTAGSYMRMCEKSPAVPNVAFSSGLKLADETVMPNCNSANSGVIRRLASSNTVQMCDGATWINQTGAAGLDDLTDVITNYVRNNIFIGTGTGNTTATGSGNTVIGTGLAGAALSTGSGNTAIGRDVLKVLTSGSYNTAIGHSVLAGTTLGNGNTVMGYQAAELGNKGNYNTAAGYWAVRQNAATGITALGNQAGVYATGTTYLTAAGYGAGYFNSTGTANTAIGTDALSNNTTGIENTAAGYASLKAMVSGGDNTAIGNQALLSSKANQSTAVGTQALKTHVNGDGNTAIGALALATANNTPSANPNTAVGYNSMTALTTGDSNTAVGYQTLLTATAQSSNVAIGREAAKSTSGSNIVAIGSDTLSGAGSTGNNVAIGYQSQKQGTGTDNISIGYQSLYNITGSNAAAAVGYQALYSQVSAVNNEAAGYQALYSNTSGFKNNAIGYQAMKANTTGGQNNAVGYMALSASNASNNTAVGYNAAAKATTNSTTGVGVEALYNNTGANNTAVGYQSLYTNTTGANNVGVGYQSLYNANILESTAVGALSQYASASYNTSVGYKTLYSNTAQDVTAVGTMAMANATGGGQSLGHFAMVNNTATVSTAAGFLAATNATGFSQSVAAGSMAGKLASSGGTSIGYNAAGAATGATSNSAGAYAAYTNQLYGTQMGYKAAWQSPAGSHNISVGSMATASNTAYAAVVALGYNSQVSANNMVRLGDTNVTLIEGQVAFTVASDRRLKKDIQASDLGLDFIMGLKPVRYRLKQGNGRLDYGFLAQDIEASLDGRTTNMITRLNDEMKTYQLRHNDLIAPIVKAIQERQAKIEDLKQQIDTLKKEPVNCGGGER